ncbi:hypothetical protein [Geodermatophilus normandii]|uniref:Uncharacterized protein n=1 Tax=Geodermatophilus normandii TaxID=1137989 RepID=A0A6P0GDR1_9ACTN|nr:hypothetical protein [Geodermatophilus normandii]NEM05547.1 hypothetical protein [Geodermatophilus normandii]
MAALAIDRTPAVAHTPLPGLARDLLAVAWEPGAAPPREVRVRPELADRLCAQLGWDATTHPLLGEPAGLPLVVDPRLPRSPGFEVRRVPPGARAHPLTTAA